MPLDLRAVQKYERVKGTLQMRLTEINPIIRLCQGTSPPLFIQGGQVWAEGGDEIENPPDWFWEQAARMTRQARKEVGLKLPNEPEEQPEAGEPTGTKLFLRDGKLFTIDGNEVVIPPTQEPAKPVAMWKCPQCYETLPKAEKGFHIARERKVMKEAQRKQVQKADPITTQPKQE